MVGWWRMTTSVFWFIPHPVTAQLMSTSAALLVTVRAVSLECLERDKIRLGPPQPSA